MGTESLKNQQAKQQKSNKNNDVIARYISHILLQWVSSRELKRSSIVRTHLHLRRWCLLNVHPTVDRDLLTTLCS